jgi:hypothetical protein
MLLIARTFDVRRMVRSSPEQVAVSHAPTGRACTRLPRRISAGFRTHCAVNRTWSYPFSQGRSYTANTHGGHANVCDTCGLRGFRSYASSLSFSNAAIALACEALGTQAACQEAYLIKDDVRDERAGRWGTTLILSNDRTSVVVNTSVPSSSS